MLKQQELPDMQAELWNEKMERGNKDRSGTVLSGMLNKSNPKATDANRTVSRVESQMKHKSESMTVIDDTQNTSIVYDGPPKHFYQA